MKTLLNKLISGLLGFLGICGTAYAGSVTQIPEPNILSLFIAGGIVAAVIAIRNRNK